MLFRILIPFFLCLFSCGEDDGFAVSVGNISSRVVWPLSRSSSPDTLADFYGPRILSGSYDFHRGIDIPAATGTPIYAIHSGTVVKAEQTSAGDSLERYGNFVVIAHSPSNVTSQSAYLHMSSYVVSVNQSVSAGQLIGYVGNSGVGINTEHLHLEYYEGVNNGNINRLQSRNPLHILPYTHVDPVISISKNDTEILVDITLSPTSVDIVRISITPNNSNEKIVDFETREGLDANDEDINPYDNVEITPQDYTSSTVNYSYRLSYFGSFSGTTSCTVVLTDVFGNTYRRSTSF